VSPGVALDAWMERKIIYVNGTSFRTSWEELRASTVNWMLDAHYEIEVDP
jgi:hypothetical protein